MALATAAARKRSALVDGLREEVAAARRRLEEARGLEAQAREVRREAHDRCVLLTWELLKAEGVAV